MVVVLIKDSEIYLVIPEREIDNEEDIHVMKKINLLITTEELMEALSCGRRRAIKIGELAGARVEIGRCVRWNVEILKEFLHREAF